MCTLDTDHERPISELGRRQSKEFSELLKVKGEQWQPSLVIASNSRRSKETLEAMEGARDVDQLFFGSLYINNSLDGQSRECIESLILEHADETHETILILGHNKGMEEAASSLSAGEVKLKSASAALLESVGTEAAAWEDLLGHHSSDLSRASRDEDWENALGGWRCVEILNPPSST